MPYLRYYEEVLKELSIPYDILYWDRFSLFEQKEHAFAYRRMGTAPGLSLLPGYAGYRRFILEHLEHVDYDLYLVLTVQIAVLLYDFLRSRRYLLDIRDYSHEGILPYRMMAHGIIKRAVLVSISSKGFLKWLPTGYDYVISHNMSYGDLDKQATPFNNQSKVCSSIGAVGYYDANVEFIKGMRMHSDIQVRYIGRGTQGEKLGEYCRSQSIPNVVFEGAYLPEEKEKYFHETNFVIGFYGSDSLLVRTLTPNRLYESCVFRRPMIVNAGTHLAGLVKANGLGIVIDMDGVNTQIEAITQYYDPAYYQDYCGRCDTFLREVARDVLLFKERVGRALA